MDDTPFYYDFYAAIYHYFSHIMLDAWRNAARRTD